MANIEHWWCPACGTFDGPHFEGACDVCAEGPGTGTPNVEGLVPRPIHIEHEHWVCRNCESVDGPTVEGDCALCREDSVQSPVVALVPADSQLAGAVEALREFRSTDKGPPCDCFSGSVIDEKRHAAWCSRRLWTERNDAREQLRRAVDLLREFDGHRVNSSLAWMDDWTRRVREYVAALDHLGRQ
jgi:hypothetical protein